MKLKKNILLGFAYTILIPHASIVILYAAPFAEEQQPVTHQPQIEESTEEQIRRENRFWQAKEAQAKINAQQYADFQRQHPENQLLAQTRPFSNNPSFPGDDDDDDQDNPIAEPVPSAQEFSPAMPLSEDELNNLADPKFQDTSFQRTARKNKYINQVKSLSPDAQRALNNRTHLSRLSLSARKNIDHELYEAIQKNKAASPWRWNTTRSDTFIKDLEALSAHIQSMNNEERFQAQSKT